MISARIAGCAFQDGLGASWRKAIVVITLSLQWYKPTVIAPEQQVLGFVCFALDNQLLVRKWVDAPLAGNKERTGETDSQNKRNVVCFYEKHKIKKRARCARGKFARLSSLVYSSRSFHPPEKRKKALVYRNWSLCLHMTIMDTRHRHISQMWWLIFC